MKRTGETKTDGRKGNIMKRALVKRCVVVVAGLLLTASSVWAKPLMTVTLTTSKEVVEVKNGVKAVKMVPTKAAVSGDVLHYTLTYTNKGDEASTNAVIDNPVPKGTVYIANSAAGENTEITFSNDGGKLYAPPVKLTYEVKLPSGKTEKRIATPADYTNIRWKVSSVAPGASGTVEFSVQVK